MMRVRRALKPEGLPGIFLEILMGTSSQKFISGFLAFAMGGALSLAPPVMAQQADTCGVIRGNKFQIDEARKNFPKPLRKKITKAFVKKLKQTRYHTDFERAEIAFRVPSNVSQELELNIEPYSKGDPLIPKVKQVLTQAIQENVEADRGGVQRDVCYRTYIEYSKPHPWRTALTIIALPIALPGGALIWLIAGGRD